MSEVLRIDDLWVEGRPPGGTYTPIVKGVSLQVAKGEVLALIGESGSGKSTISLAAMGFARPGCRIASGRVQLGGEDVMTLSPAARHALRGRSVAYVAQSAVAAFNPALTIGEQVIEAPLWHGTVTRAEAEARAVDLYRRLDLPNADSLGRRYPHQVSGGQLQRLMAAMAMSCEPELLILDEPTTALDVTTQIEVLGAFKEIIRAQGTAAIYVSHDLAVIAQVADRALVLKDGNTVEVGDIGEILHRPTKPYTRALMDAIRPAPQRDQKAETPLEHAQPILSVRNIEAGYGRHLVLQDVSVDVAPGKVVAVIGESGCGKSTLARVVAGLTPARTGRVEIAGKTVPSRVAERSRDSLRDCQIVFQMADTALNPRHRVRDLIGRPLTYYHGLKGDALNRRVAALLERVELPAAFASRFPAELSGGQKQRVNLARALAAEPKIILCDEVTSALDTIVAAGVLELLRDLKTRSGLSFLFISHDLSTVSSFADEVLVLYAGRVVERGPVACVFAPPYHPYTQLLLDSVPELRQGWLEEIVSSAEARAASAGSVQQSVHGCPFANRCTRVMPDVCTKTMPPLRDLAAGHQIACHLSEPELPTGRFGN